MCLFFLWTHFYTFSSPKGVFILTFLSLNIKSLTLVFIHFSHKHDYDLQEVKIENSISHPLMVPMVPTFHIFNNSFEFSSLLHFYSLKYKLYSLFRQSNNTSDSRIKI